MANHFNHGYALLIAVDRSVVPEAALPDVIKDVNALFGVLTHPGRCGYLPENVQRITGEVSTRDGIIGGLDWLQQKLAADQSGETTAVIYFTGHGHIEGDK